MIITSTKNERIKALQRLSKSSERRKEDLFIIEGKRELEKAIAANYTFTELYYAPELIAEEEINQLFFKDIPKTAVSHHVFEAIAYRENRDGLIVLSKPKTHRLEDLQLGTPPLVIVLEAVEKPGNLGAILRTADASGADAVIVCDPKTDVYNPNVIRASIGCVFSKQIACCTSQEALAYFQAKDIATLATTPYTESIYFQQNLTQPLAIVMGTEADGLSDYWLKQAKLQVKVPMLGEADSLNVSVCLSVVIYEAVRQRLCSVV